MSLLNVLRGAATGSASGRRTARPWSSGSGRGRGRRVLAAALGPVLAAGTSLTPAVAVAAGVTAAAAVAAVAHAPAAKASPSGSVLVLLQNGESSAPETTALESAGYSASQITQITPATWATEPASYFEGFSALVVGDPSTSTSCSTLSPANESLGSTWQAAVSGNVAVIGAAPAMPGTAGSKALITDAVGYAAAAYTGTSGNTGTGLYVSLNCQYSTASSGTAVSWLAGVEGIGGAGGLTVNGSLTCTNAGTVSTVEADSSGPFAGFAASSLGTGSGGFPSPACPVEEAFDSWPSNFTPLAFDTSSAVTNYTSPTGQAGQPYVLLGTEPLAQAAGQTTDQQAQQTATETLALASASGGEVPAGATTGGSNPADSAVSQATAADPVNTENGDFTQDATDLSIPTYGPPLEFDRSYDSLAAQAEEKTGTPGPLGYGWTDNWATTATGSSPVADDIYSLSGEAGATGASDLAQYAANGQPATSAPISYPAGVLVVSGNVYFSDTQGNRVQEIPATTGTQWGISMTAGDVYTIAGAINGQQGSTGDGGPAASALLNYPMGLSMDTAGNLYIADWGNYRVQEIAKTTGTQYGQAMTANDIYTVAGGRDGTAGDGGSATEASLGNVFSVGVDSSGNMYIADTENNRVQEVPAATGSQWGQSMTAGDMYTIAGSASGTAGESPSGTAADASELDSPSGVFTTSAGLYIADTDNCRVVELAASAGSQWNISMTASDLYIVAGRSNTNCTGGATGKPATQSDLKYPTGVIYSGGNLFIPSTQAQAVQEVAGAAGTQFGQSMTFDDVYTIAGTGTAGDTGNGGLGTSAEVNNPESVSQYNGTLYIADTFNNQIRAVNSSGDISVVAGSGQTLASMGNSLPAVNAYLDDPGQEVADSHGDLYIADSQDNRIQEIAAWTHTQWGITMTAGDIYTIAGSALGQPGNSGDSGAATAALLQGPASIAIDSAGNLLIADTANNQVRVVAAASGTYYGVAMTANDIYTIAGSTAGTAGSTPSGTAAASALLNVPNGVTTDAKGDVFIADKHNNAVEEISASGGESFGQTMTAGDLYVVAGNGTSGSPANGTLATSAELAGPQSVTVDSHGNLYISDTSDEAIQEVPDTTGTYWGQKMTADDIYTIAGTSQTAGSTGDGGPATSAQLHTPVGIATDTAGDLYIADLYNDRIQEVPAASGTQWGQQMTAGDIYTIAGQTGISGASGDGGPATAAELESPTSVALDQSGNLYIGDWHSGRLREVVSSTTPTIAAPPGLTSALYPAPGGITITQSGGSQVTFYSQTGGTCPAPYVTGGSYCVLPQFDGATLTASGTTSWTFTPAPGSDSWTYSQATGQLTTETDTAGDTLAVTYQYPAPGSATSTTSAPITSTAITCPSSAHTCDTIDSASGRALVLGLNSSGLVTTVTDPLGRTWTYGYNSSDDLTSVTDPLGNETSYGYDTGNANPLLTADMLTVTAPTAQSGYSGADADPGDQTVNTYNTAGQVTAQTDPMGWTTTFSYCSTATSCLNPATGTGNVTVTDPDGNTTVYSYDQGTLADQTTWTGAAGTGTLTSQQVTLPDTAVTATTGTTAATDGSLQPTATFDGDNNETSYAYDATGDTTSTTSPSGGSTASGTQATTAGYTSTSQGDQQNCAGAAEASSTDTCNDGASGPAAVAPGGVISPPSSAPPLGVTWTLNDTDGNQLYSTTGVYSATGTYEYSQTTYQLFKGNSITLNSTSISCTWTPPSASLPCATINADGVVTQLEYNAQGDQILSSTPDGNSGGQVAETANAYDADGEQVSTTAPDGEISGANAGSYTTTTSYNADGEKTSVVQGNGSGYTDTPRTTSYGYDGDGNQTTVEDARGNTTTTGYNPDNEQTTVKNPDGDTALTCYDGDGNVTETVPPVGVAGNSLTAASCPTSYPADYNPATKAPLASDSTLTAYDAQGDKTAVYTPAPAGQSGYETTTYTYDGNGNQLTETSPPATNGGSSQVTADTYNSGGQLATQTTGYGTSAASTVSYCYDPDGDKTAVTYADGNTSGTAACETSYPWVISASTYPTQAAYQTTYAYDSAGDLVSTVTPANSVSSTPTTTATYDAAGNMLTQADPDGVTTTWTYTPLNQIATISYSGSSAHSVSCTYDASGNQTAMADATGTSTNTYDSFGELTSAENGAGQTVSYGYNADGQVTGITYPLGSGATWATSDTVAYGYDNADELTSVTDFNGHQITIGSTADGLQDSVGLGSSGDTITTSYDPADNPSAIALKNSSATLQSFTYSDSPAGTILSETDTPTSSGSPADYTYDARGRVTSMTPGTGAAKDYSFDASGNLTTLPTGATVSSNGYNDAEELTSSALSGTTTTYTYNADGEQIGSAQGSTTVSSATWNGAQELATYDNSAADMTAAIYNGDGLRASDTIGGTSQDFVWNGDNLLMDGTSAYIYAGGQAPAEQVNLSAGTITYLVTDSLGSVRGTVSSTGVLTGTTSYDAWGNPATAGGLTATTPFGYAGAYTDHTGLLYLINRYYDPATGQFTSVDPDLSQTLQPYGYTDGDPVTDTDPTGLEDVLGDHATCENVHDGKWKATICVQVNSSPFLGMNFRSEPQVVFLVKSGAIANVGAETVGMEVCGQNHAGHPRNCHQNNQVTHHDRATCSGRECYINGGWYTNSEVNWEDTWVKDAWLQWQGGPRLKAGANIHEHPLCRIGDGGGHGQCPAGNN
jgi:trimeric autotransporter adhesin